MPQKFHIITWCIRAELAAAPFVLMHSLLDPAQSIRYIYLTLFTASITVSHFIIFRDEFLKSLSQIITWRDPVLLAGIVWLLATVVSISVALQFSEAIAETSRVGFFILSFIFICTWIKTDERNVANLAAGFCLMSAALCAIGIKDFYFAWQQVTPADGYYHVSGNMGNRNLFAIMVSLCLPFHFIAFDKSRKAAIRVALSINFLIGLTLVILTSSRTGWLSILVLIIVCAALLAAGYYKGFFEKLSLRKLSLGSLIVIVGMSAFFSLFLVSNSSISSHVKQRLASFYNYKTESNIHNKSIQERFTLWASSVQLIKEHPLTGVGAGNWKFRYPEKGLPERCQTGEVAFMQPHNDFLWVFAETGVIGGMAFAALFAVALAASLRSFWQGKDVILHLAVIAGISMYAVQSFFDFPKERPLILFAFAGLLALANIQKPHPDPLQSSPAGWAERGYSASLQKNWLSLTLLLTLIISFLIAGFWSIRMWCEFNLKKATVAHQQGNFADEKIYLNKVCVPLFESDLTGAPIDWYKSKIAYYEGDLESFKKYSESALRLNPYHLYILYNLGTIYYWEGDTVSAVKYWEQALNVAPKFADAAVNLSVIYYNKGNLSKAVSLLSRPDIDYSNKANERIVTSVIGAYVLVLSSGISDPLLKSKLEELSMDRERLKQIQQRLSANKEPVDSVLLKFESITETLHP
ncbi:MAG: hypothetical protein KatS3mg031_1251 [Chitinophagales bacterium]|nr:MAG: hypothetical protein KatS3mg031_1251 [Chitinophagales bacterium]